MKGLSAIWGLATVIYGMKRCIQGLSTIEWPPCLSLWVDECSALLFSLAWVVELDRHRATQPNVHPFITRLTYRDKQPSTLTFTHTGNLEGPVIYYYLEAMFWMFILLWKKKCKHSEPTSIADFRDILIYWLKIILIWEILIWLPWIGVSAHKVAFTDSSDR